MTNWKTRYLPSDPSLWQGRAELPKDSCFFQHITLRNLLTEQLEKAKNLTFAIIGFQCDEGIQRDTGRTGAFEGPIAIRQRLGKLPIQNPTVHCLDVGNIICTDHDLEASQAALGEVIDLLLQHNLRPIVIGGGHELAWGHYLGITKYINKNKRLGILNFDSHFDLHPIHAHNRSSSSTSFYQIAEDHQTKKRNFDYNCIGIQHTSNIRQSFDMAKKNKVKMILADELHQGLQEKCFDFIDRIIDENDFIYVSLSLDVFNAAYAPGVATIQPLGLNPWHVIPLLRQVATSGKVISYDIAEHVPRYDIDHRTAKLAAMLIYEMIHHHTLNNKN